MSWVRESKLSWIQRLAIRIVKAGHVPKHVAFIMDGNRRYAKKNNVKKVDGHSKGWVKSCLFIFLAIIYIILSLYKSIVIS